MHFLSHSMYWLKSVGPFLLLKFDRLAFGSGCFGDFGGVTRVRAIY